MGKLSRKTQTFPLVLRLFISNFTTLFMTSVKCAPVPMMPCTGTLALGRGAVGNLEEHLRGRAGRGDRRVVRGRRDRGGGHLQGRPGRRVVPGAADFPRAVPLLLLPLPRFFIILQEHVNMLKSRKKCS